MTQSTPDFLTSLRDVLPRTESLIDGKWIEPVETVTVLDKYTGTPIAEVGEASTLQVEQAVTVARQAADGPIPDPMSRARSLRKAADLLESRRAAVATLLTAEAGFPIADAQNEIDRAIVTLNLSAEAGLRLVGDMVPFAASPGAHRRIGFTQRFPVGVVCAITPFNSPLNTVLHKVGPAYAGGNAVILKPSALTPLTAAALAEILLEADVPPAFLSLLHGEGDRVGTALLENQGIDFYTFTGSTRVGRIIQAAAGLRRTQMELGSIASTIVCADADIDRAIPKIINAGFRKAGQVCTSVQRLYVQEAVANEVLDKLCTAVGRLVAGDPRDPGTHLGPLISRQAAERSIEWIEAALQQGARLHCGGTRDGSVVQPTVLTDVPDAAQAWCQEAFAPIVALRPFERLDEALAGANSTPYGLSAGIFTSDINAAMQAAGRLRFGSVHVNEASSARADVMPFGGVKHSGFGREGPDYAIREMTEERLLTINP
ncbi:MAG TPA: aldehyde dehydrogenase family protein [Burkholderiaceae bacterium]|nr:aldehyde dehydrogenase family protein [Burkholderiaceae bacterium]